jgi:ubiquinone/menaquinone biosynthesis C-methylase UbiE
VDAELGRRLEESGYDRPGFARDYDRFRPRPPQALLDLLPPLAGVDRPALVVDLGCGTGLSTRFWSERADEVVGVEPNAAMRTLAEKVTDASNVRYVGASAYETGLPDACADLVTAAQSLQWMQPDRVFPEIGRVLRPSGVFCAYEYVGLQTPLWRPEAQWQALRARTRELRAARGLDERKVIWPISSGRLEESGVFRDVRELVLHSVEQGDGERLIGLALSEGSLTTLLAAGATEEDVGLDRLRAVAATIGEPVPWWIGYRAWIGLR